MGVSFINKKAPVRRLYEPEAFHYHFENSLFIFSCEDNDKDDCIDESKITNFPCDDEYEPVCGCDVVTYSNDCVAENSGVTEWTEGECN